LAFFLNAFKAGAFFRLPDVRVAGLRFVIRERLPLTKLRVWPNRVMTLLLKFRRNPIDKIVTVSAMSGELINAIPDSPNTNRVRMVVPI